MRDYEIMFILDPRLDDREVDGVLERFQRFLREKGGEVVSIDRWGRRRLAYEIMHRQDGYYAVVTFRAAPEVVKDLGGLRFWEEVLRYKVLRLEAPKKEARAAAG
jgi:small subunit ribosomal protein S6